MVSQYSLHFRAPCTLSLNFHLLFLVSLSQRLLTCRDIHQAEKNNTYFDRPYNTVGILCKIQIYLAFWGKKTIYDNYCRLGRLDFFKTCSFPDSRKNSGAIKTSCFQLVLQACLRKSTKIYFCSWEICVTL